MQWSHLNFFTISNISTTSCYGTIPPFLFSGYQEVMFVMYFDHWGSMSADRSFKTPRRCSWNSGVIPESSHHEAWKGWSSCVEAGLFGKDYATPMLRVRWLQAHVVSPHLMFFPLREALLMSRVIQTWTLLSFNLLSPLLRTFIWGGAMCGLPSLLRRASGCITPLADACMVVLLQGVTTLPQIPMLVGLML